ncbi:MAG: hypothetical protein CL920_18130 [Deltaproteobacteria bacterium]|nr:hypothetical protein [Deltaproteobacteria bacterium]
MAAEAQQIAGRAGRYGLHEAGFVGAFEEEHLEVVQGLLQERMHPTHGPYGIPPSLEHLKLLSSCLESSDLPELLRYYRREAWFDEPFLVPFVPEQMLTIAEELEPVIEEAPLTLKYAFSLAPIPTKFKRLLREHKRLAKAYVEGKPWAFPLSQLHPYFADYSENERQLYLAEEQSQRLTLYSWLAHRFPERFVAGEDAETFRAIVERFLSRSLSKGTPIRRCRRCGVKLAPFYRFQICQPCHHGKTFYQ